MTAVPNESLPNKVLVAIGCNATHPENISGTSQEQKVIAANTAKALLALMLQDTDNAFLLQFCLCLTFHDFCKIGVFPVVILSRRIENHSALRCQNDDITLEILFILAEGIINTAYIIIDSKNRNLFVSKLGVDVYSNRIGVIDNTGRI